jgi:peptide/nickel transport system permease protein
MTTSTAVPDATDPAPAAADAPPRPIPAWRILAGNPVTVVAAVLLLLVLVIAIAGGSLAPYDVTTTDVAHTLEGPSTTHLFGTDELGRDVFSRVLAATRVSLEVAVVSVAFCLVVGTTIGVLAGYLGGAVDAILMRIVDVLFAFPVILLALAIITILGPGLATTMIAVGIVYTPIFARVTRASTLSTKVETYIQVSRTMGTPGPWIVLRRILPGISGPLIVQTSVSLAFAILSEATLSFLGMGIQPPQPSWGRMIFDAQSFLHDAWWLSVFPGLAILLTVLAFTLLGDGLRDVTDPRQRSLMETRIRR